MNKNKKWVYISALFIIAIGSTAFYIYKEYNRKNEDTGSLRPDYVVTASTIIKEFETDQESATKKYSDKIILIEGYLKDILKDDRGFYSLMIGDTTSMSSVKCSMDTAHNQEAASLQKGTAAVIKGVCAGFNADELLGSDVILVRCIIDQMKNNPSN
ncbi:MAG TPA: hypothetical protein VF144_06500 [Chitinophagaceae bacterium]